MKNLEILEKRILELNSKKKEIKEEIAKQTEMLQKQLTEIELEIKSINKDIKKINENKVHDKSVHILDRYELWREMKHEKSRWLIDRGPIRSEFFDDGNRYQTYSIVETLDDFLSEYLCLELDEDEFPEIDLEYSLLTDEGRKIFDEILNEEQKKGIANLIENAIEMNIDKFKYDW